MNAVNKYFKTAKLNWQIQWRKKNFRTNLFLGLVFITVILICFPYFFQYIEQRKGAAINDVVLHLIPPLNVSIPIFILIWSCVIIMLHSAIRNPEICLTFLIAYIQLCLLRIITISLFPLQAPPGIVILIDPLSNYFYGVPFISKDLFFSGHTATLFLMFLCNRNKWKKYFFLITCIIVAFLVLVQHIHYTVDVVFAFPFTWLCYFSARFLTNKKI